MIEFLNKTFTMSNFGLFLCFFSGYITGYLAKCFALFLHPHEDSYDYACRKWRQIYHGDEGDDRHD